jgi:glycosyltransferase involved in cell wall biosynthesis
MLVEAGTLLPEGWTLVMMGWGPLSDALHKIAASGGQQAARKIRFIPAAHRDELQRWTAGATAGIIPYENTVLNHWFCSPNKLWEYPSSGVPLIVQPFPELKKVIETYRCGWLLPEDLNPRAIANLIAGLSDAMIAEARAGCRAFLQADNWDSLYANRLIDLYKRLTASRAGADYTPHAPDRMAAQ